MMKPNSNGWLVKAGLTGLFAITALGLTGSFASRIMNEQTRAQAMQQEQGERISRLEAVQVSIGDTLARMDRKLDRVLERKEK